MVPTLEKIQEDELAMTVARVTAIANQIAMAQGINLTQSLVTISEESMENLWRIHYGPRDYKNRRGGDLMVFVDEKAGKVQKIVRGQ